MQKLNHLLNEFELKIPLYKKTNPSISSSTIGWQIEHSLKTILLIVDTIKKSNPDNYKWEFNKNRFLILMLNFIPRGRAKAPKIVQPNELITQESLRESLEKARQNLSNWKEIDTNSYFTHPYFGDLNKSKTEWFLLLHTKHHFKIVNDISKST